MSFCCRESGHEERFVSPGDTDFAWYRQREVYGTAGNVSYVESRAEDELLSGSALSTCIRSCCIRALF